MTAPPGWLPAIAGATLAAVAAGAAGAWWMHRRSDLSPRNLYLVWLLAIGGLTAAGITGPPPLIAALVLAALSTGTAAGLGRRWRLSALGAGGELREHELARRMAWQPRRRAANERVTIGSQGELIRERAWPSSVPALPMTADGRGRIPLAEGMHLYFVGATGAGKTTSARRWLLARGLDPETPTSILALDPKGDRGLEHDLRAIATAQRRPFVLFDPFDTASDRWNPIWADDPGAVVARLVTPVEADADSDASHYSRLLRVHLGLVAEALYAAGQWPIAMPALLRCAHRERFEYLSQRAKQAGAESDLQERLDDHRAALNERSTRAQLDGSLRALEVVAGHAWRRVLSPHPTRGAVTLPTAMAAGAVVLWRTHVEEIREEAEMITTLALADIGAAALTLPEHDRQWALLIDEFGSVLQSRAGERAVALMQRARSAHGQVAVSTQSVSDVAAATGNEPLLASLADNFTGFILHRQTSPESRDWLAMLLGTRELWQSTDRTSSGRGDGTGSRRRAAEFVVRPDDFKRLGPGQAVVWTTLGPGPELVTVTPGPHLDATAPPTTPVYDAVRVMTVADALSTPAAVSAAGNATATDLQDAPAQTGAADDDTEAGLF